MTETTEQWTRAELEEAFAEFQRRAEIGGQTGDWGPWVEVFTEDAHYIEHHYGEFHGREQIRAWIESAMTAYPASEMDAFPIGWYVVDEARGWIVCQVWNRMRDIGDGQVHQAYNLTLLKYAGSGMWSYEEDVYNPAHFGTMVAGWIAAQKTVAGGSSGGS